MNAGKFSSVFCFTLLAGLLFVSIEACNINSARRRVESLLNRFKDLVDLVRNGTIGGPVNNTKLIQNMKAEDIVNDLTDEQKTTVKSLLNVTTPSAPVGPQQGSREEQPGSDGADRTQGDGADRTPGDGADRAQGDGADRT